MSLWLCVQPIIWENTSEGFLPLSDNHLCGQSKAHSKLSWFSLLPWFFLPPCEPLLRVHIMSQAGKDLGRLYLALLYLLSKITLISFWLVPCSRQANQFQSHKAASFPCLFITQLTFIWQNHLFFMPHLLSKIYLLLLATKLLVFLTRLTYWNSSF